jgi:hypothetical protein
MGVNGGCVNIVDKKLKSIGSVTRANTVTPYSIGDVIGADPGVNIEFQNFGRAGQGFIILKAMLMVKVSAIPTGMSGFRLHLYNAAPTAIVDNLPMNLIAADRDKYIGYIEFGTPIDLGDTLISQVENLTVEDTMVTTSLYGVLETLGAYTPTASSVKEIRLFGVDA